MENETVYIYIVDENKSFLSTLGKKLAKSIDTVVHSFSSVPTCLEKIKQNKPDMIYLASNTKGAPLLMKEMEKLDKKIPIFTYSSNEQETLATHTASKQLNRKARILRVAVKKAINRIKYLKEKKEERAGKTRIVSMIVFCVLAVALTMLIYPNALPWLIGFFLVIGTISVFFGERMTTH